MMNWCCIVQRNKCGKKNLSILFLFLTHAMHNIKQKRIVLVGNNVYYVLAPKGFNGSNVGLDSFSNKNNLIYQFTCLSVCMSEPVHFDQLTISVRPILQPQMTETRSRNELHLTWNVQRQVRVVVAERHTLAGSSVSPHQPSIALLINK